MALARTLRGTKLLSYATQATATLTCDSFTPASSALLVVMFEEYTNDSTPSLTMSTTGINISGSWTLVSSTQNDGAGWYTTRIAYAQCTSSPGTGTITCTRRAGTFTMGMFAEYVEVTGQDTTTPIAQSKGSVVGTGTSLATDFTSAPTSTSMAFFSLIDDGGTPTVPSATTLLGSYDIAGVEKCRHAEKGSSPAQNNSWTGLGNYLNAAAAIEVAEAAAPAGRPVSKTLGGWASWSKGVW